MNYNQATVERATSALKLRGYNAETSFIAGTEKCRVTLEVDLPEDEIEQLENEIKEEFGVECWVFPEKIIYVDDDEEEVYSESI